MLLFATWSSPTKTHKSIQKNKNRLFNSFLMSLIRKISRKLSACVASEKTYDQSTINTPSHTKMYPLEEESGQMVTA